MKYIGNKSRLIGFIEDCLKDFKVDYKNVKVYDLFSGTGSVSEFFLKHNCKVLSCDNMNYAIAEQYRKLFFRKAPEFNELKKIVGYENLDGILNYLNGLEGEKGYFFENFCEEGKYKRKFFSVSNAKKIDAIRNKKLDLIEEKFCKYITSKHSPSYGSNKIILSSDINKEYYTIYKRNFGLLNIKDKDNELSYQKFIDMKNKVILSKVLDKDIKFIEKACKTATQKELDEALTQIASDNFKGIKILLDAGAKVHKEWIDEDGVRRDEIDNIETDILKEKIKNSQK